MTPSEIAATIRQHRFHYSNEGDLQLGIAQLLGCQFKRECRLSAQERPDFFEETDGIAVEIKVKGSFGSVLAQLERYAKLDAVRGLVLVTTRSQQSLRMPYILNGKPLAVCLISSLC